MRGCLIVCVAATNRLARSCAVSTISAAFEIGRKRADDAEAIAPKMP